MSISYLIGNYVGKERNTMHVKRNWFVEKIQKALKLLRSEKIDSDILLWLEEWRVVHDSVQQDEEDMEQQEQDYLAEYERQCREKKYRQWLDIEEELRKYEENQALAKALIEKESEVEALKNEEAEELFYEELANEWPCQDCGKFGSKCTCTSDEDTHNLKDDEDDERDSEETIINRQNAAFDEEEEPASPEVEYWFTRCTKCNSYPEFCTCHEDGCDRNTE